MDKKQHDLSGIKRSLHPQEDWEWPIAVYLYLAGMGAGAFAVGVLTDWLVRPDIPYRAVLLWGPLFVAIGAPFLILDLGKKTRFLNACLNPRTSWAGRGFLILSSLIITGLGSFALAALPDLLPLAGIEAPGWLENRAVARALEAIALVLSFGTAAYTGIFLKSVRYIPLWNTWLLPVLFTVSALSTGSMAVVVALLGFGEITGDPGFEALTHSIIPVEQVLVLVEGAVLALFVVFRYRARQASADSVRLLVKAELRLVFWIGVVVLGLVLPVILENVYSAFPDYPSLLFVTGASLLAGGFFLRYGIVKAGIKDQHPGHKLAALAYDWTVYRKPATGRAPNDEQGTIDA
jgi:formate-dependent nitrite reductase membrane component NrfD